MSGWRSWERLELSIMLLADQVPPVSNLQKVFNNPKIAGYFKLTR